MNEIVIVPYPIPRNRGQISFQTVRPPCRKYCPILTSRKRIGAAPNIKKMKYGMKNAPVFVMIDQIEKRY